MRRFLTRAMLGAGAVGATSFGTAYYMFPEIRQDYNQLFKATERIMRLSCTGLHMAYIYGLKSESMHDKHVEASKLLFEGFKENGGVYIKIGQILASVDILAPDEYIQTLSHLYQSAKASSFESVKEQIEETLGQKMEDIFSYFDPVPLSAASIGQVHEARLKNGEKVAVKVQHKWLKEQCQGDIRVIETLISIGEFLFPEFKYKWFGEELKKYIPNELNFSLEVENADRTKELFKKRPNIRVPHFYHEYSNDKVIVMEFVKGVSIDKVKEIRNMGLDIKDVAKLLSHCFFIQIFKYGHVHADPHPGNLFISAEVDSKGNKKPILTLLDHGLYQDLNNKVRLEYSYLWKGILLRDEAMIKQAATDLGVGQWYPLLAAMVSRKTFNDIMDDSEKDYQKRLRATHTQEERDQLQGFAKEYTKEIMQVLHDINKDVVLLLKIDNFLTTIANRLGDPVNKYEILARYCLEAVEHQELQNKNDFSSRFRLWYQKSSTLLALKLYGLYYSFVSLFRPHEIPDQILL